VSRNVALTCINDHRRVNTEAPSCVPCRLACDTCATRLGRDGRQAGGVRTVHRAAVGALPGPLPGDVGDIARFPTKGHFASWNGTAPIDASSGENNRHRLSRSGNRRLNRVLHIRAIVHLRNDTEGRRYLDRKKPSGKSSREAMRCLKRRLSDVVYRQTVADAERKAATRATPDDAPARPWFGDRALIDGLRPDRPGDVVRGRSQRSSGAPGCWTIGR
jgi:hypothetical protein